MTDTHTQRDSELRPSHRQIFEANAVKIWGGSTPHYRRADALFERLPNTGHRSRDAKRRYFRAVFAAARRALYSDLVVWTELHDTKTSDAERRVLDALGESGRLVAYKPTKTRCTRYYITGGFRSELSETPLPRQACGETVLLRGRSKKLRREGKSTKRATGKPIPFDASHPVAVDTREALRLINEVNMGHRFWSYRWNPYNRDFDGSVKNYDPLLRAIFTERFERHGRLYTQGAAGYQQMRKTERGRFYIDDQICAELDYRWMVAQLAYNLCGLPCHHDAYDFLGAGDAPRAVAKRVFHVLIGAKSRIAASFGVAKAVGGQDHNLLSEAAQNANAVHRAWRTLGKPAPRRMLAAAEDRHRAIRQFFYADKMPEFMRHDGAIALDILHDLACRGIPAAGFHDSFCVQNRHQSELLHAMIARYEDRFGFEPRVKLM